LFILSSNIRKNVEDFVEKWLTIRRKRVIICIIEQKNRQSVEPKYRRENPVEEKA